MKKEEKKMVVRKNINISGQILPSVNLVIKYGIQITFNKDTVLSE